MADSAAKRRYRRTFIALCVAYLVALVGVDELFRHHLLGGPIAYAAAVLPAVPIIAMFAAIARYLAEERDEFLRMLMVRQTLVAGAVAVGLATVWGFLESFGLVARVDAHAVALLWFVGLGVGALFNAATSGADG